MEFCLVTLLNSFSKYFYENSTSISLETQYDFQYINVEIVLQNKTEILTKSRLTENNRTISLIIKNTRNRKLISRNNITSTIKNNIKHTLWKVMVRFGKSKISIKSNEDVLSEKNSLYYQKMLTLLKKSRTFKISKRVILFRNEWVGIKSKTNSR